MRNMLSEVNQVAFSPYHFGISARSAAELAHKGCRLWDGRCVACHRQRGSDENAQISGSMCHVTVRYSS